MRRTYLEMEDWGETEGRDVFEDPAERESEILGPDGRPFIIRQARRPIGFRVASRTHTPQQR